MHPPRTLSRGEMAVIQFHHEFPDGHTQMCFQGEVIGHHEMATLFEQNAPNHPLPAGAKWLVVEEDSPLFWKTLKS